uniref:transcription termination factor Rho n=1 Tax=Collinsella sp. BA40 TaxID=2560852 RepID=UPI0021022686|nr:transcription termination factor Rho [Collinsella sp. BA40]
MRPRPVESAEGQGPLDGGEAPAPAPRRRGRKPKDARPQADAKASQVSGDAREQHDAVADPAREDAATAEKPAPKRTRKPRVKKAAPAAAAEGEPSAETLQARALAQISQASVERRQRRIEKRAVEMLAGGDAPAPVEDTGSAGVADATEEKPVAVRRAAARKKPARAASADAPVSDGAPSAAEPAAPAPTDEAPAPAPAIEIPFVDPALRPNRRGRKPKAYVEAERAAAAALEAAQRAALEAAQRDAAAGEGDTAAAEQRSPETEQQAASDSREAKAERDVRPGRSRRASKEKRDGEQVARNDEQAASEGKAKRAHNDRKRAHGEDRAEQKQGAGDRADKRANRQQNNRKNRNNRFNAPSEPSLSREELAGYKVAELREKAKELEIDYAGMKKAELVEEVYTAAARAEGFRDLEGILDITHDGFGYIRARGYMPSRDDAFVPANMIRGMGLRAGDYICCSLRPSRANDKFPGVAKIASVNGNDPETMKRRPKFADLTPIYPNEPLKMEHGRDSITGRAIDIVAPVGKGQRGLIVSPPKAGKTTILKKICQAIATNNPEVHLICLLVDERPEEVTDMQRSIKGDVVASTFDMPADNHTRVAELVIERAKRLVEMGEDVVVVLDSITRLARAYNLAAPASGRILSGGVDSAALYPPKRFLGAARNIENGGSLTILASALVDTGSKMDEVIFEEFKGTGNMELKLDRDLADRRIFPAIDPVQSGTRNEDLLVEKSMQPFVWGIRRILANMNNTERAAAAFIKGLKGTDTNQEFLIRSAKKAADHEVM